MIGLASLVPLRAAPIVLTVDAGSSSATTVITDNGEAEGEAEASGQLLGQVTLHPVTRKPQTFRFDGGSLTYSDNTSQYTPNMLPAVEDLELTGTGLAASLRSANGLPPVDPVTGIIDNAYHVQTLDAGTLRTVYRLSFFGNWTTIADETTDFAATPQTNGFTGTTTLSATLLATGPLLERHRIVLTHLADESPMVNTDFGITLTTVSSGGFTARGETLVPNAAFQTWILAAGAIEPISPETRLGNIPGAVLYALGLPSAARDLPWELDATANTLTLHVPAGGTHAPVRVEHSTELNGWQTLTLPGGGTELSIGSSGTVVIPLPADSRGFCRLAVVAAAP